MQQLSILMDNWLLHQEILNASKMMTFNVSFLCCIVCTCHNLLMWTGMSGIEIYIEYALHKYSVHFCVHEKILRIFLGDKMSSA